VGTDTASDLDLIDAGPPGPDDSSGGPGGGFGVFASVAAQMATAATAGRPASAEDRRRRLFERMHQIPLGAIQIQLTAGAGAFQMPDLLAPKAGFMWSVRRLTASNFTAGTVQVYKNGYVLGGAAVGGELVVPFAGAGTSTFGRGEILLDQNDQLVIVASGITLAAGVASVQIQGAADCFERWLLPEYLM